MEICWLQRSVGPQYPEAGAVVDGRVLVVLAASAAQRAQELDVHLHPVAGERLLVPFPPLGMPPVPLGAGQTVHVETFQDAPHPRGADSDVVVALEIHGDLVRPEVVAAPQVDDPAHHISLGGVRTRVRAG